GVGLQQANALADVVGMVNLEAPGVEADRDVIGKRIGAGEVEVDQAGELIAEKEDIVGEQIGMDYSLRQGTRPVPLEVAELLGEERPEVALHFVGMRAAMLVERPPAVDRQGVGALERKVEAGKVQPRERTAERGTMSWRGPSNPHPIEEGDDRRRPSCDRAENLALTVLDRLRTGDVAAGEMFHEAEEERQILCRHALLIQRQDEIALAGMDQEVRV